MAEYIKFRLTAAKFGVSMALIALIAGVAEKVQSKPTNVQPQPAAQFLKLTGLGSHTAYNFSKLEKKLLKLDSAFVKLQQKVDKVFYNKLQVDQTFLKIADANAKWLKIADANVKWLKIADANAEFLKIGDANAQFLKIDGTAANSALLGNLRPDQFFQGRGNVLSGEITASQTQQVLLGDGSVRVLVGLSPAGAPSITLANDTSSPLSFTLNGGSSNGSTVPAGGQTALTPTAGQMDIQVFGGSGTGKIWTATISDVGSTFVGQMLVGLL